MADFRDPLDADTARPFGRPGRTDMAGTGMTGTADTMDTVDTAAVTLSTRLTP